MGVVGDLWSIVKDIGKTAGTIVAKTAIVLKDNKGNIVDFVNTIFDVLRPSSKGDGTGFNEFKVSMVAPSGFGKTTLLVTIMNDASNYLDNPSAGLKVGYKDSDDEKRIKEAQKSLSNAILAGKEGFTRAVDTKLLGTSEVKKFDFYYRLSNGAENIDQPFSIMDIPGGWINPNNRITAEMNAKWEDFKNHLHDSRLLFVPIDATLLMEATSKAEREAAVALLDVNNTGELIKEWAKYRKESNKSSTLIFVPIKCEKYRSKETFLINKVKDFYASIATEARTILPSISMYCIPLESLGCVEFSKAKWCTDKGSESFSPSFKLVGDCIQKTRNANTLFAMMYHMAEEEIKEVLDHTDEQLKKASTLGKLLSPKVKEMSKTMDAIKTLLEPMRRSLREYGNIDRMGSYQIFW